MGVFVEALVEVAHAEEQERIGVFGLEFEILATARGESVAAGTP